MSKVGRFSTLIPLVLIQDLITFLIAVVISFVSSLSNARTKSFSSLTKNGRYEWVFWSKVIPTHTSGSQSLVMA